MYLEFPLYLSRHGFTARDVCRAGDIWRSFQDIAMFGSAEVGWSPARYKKLGIAFVMREMTAVHDREAVYGEAVKGRTCISDFRRGLLTTRQVWLEGELGPIARASQEWAHVKLENGAMRPARASEQLQSAFHLVEGLTDAALPAFEPAPGREHRFSFRCWHTWMDPLAHANHPLYVDWADEAISVVMATAGLDPLQLVPVAERVKWRTGVQAPQQVTVVTRRIGRTDRGDVVCEHQILADEALAATTTTVRTLVGDGGDALALALG